MSTSAGANAATPGQQVDMIELARETTRRELQTFPGAIKLVAPAKVNLFLAVGDKRPDGYHNVTNIMHAIMLHDVLYLRLVQGAEAAGDAGAGAAVAASAAGDASEGATPASAAPTEAASAPAGVQVKVTCWGAGGVDVPALESEDNIAHRAVVQLAQALGRTETETIEIRIEKHIPHQAGLGGGSSDAAAALLGAAQMWGVPADHPALEQVAHSLGIDVAFFLHGGCACFGGAGEVFERQLAARHESLVLIKPEGGLSTAAVYGAFDENPQLASADELAAAQAAQKAADVPLFNNMTGPAERLMPELAEIRTWAAQQPGVQDVLLCGSGSTTFAVCSDFNEACKVAAAAKLHGWWARTSAFGAAKAAVVPSGR